MQEHLNSSIYIMKQENKLSEKREEPTISYRPVTGFEVRSLDNAVAALKEGDENVLYSFMRIAEEVAREGDRRIATNIRDRVISSVSNDMAKEQWVQEILAMMNDAMDQARVRVKTTVKKPVKTKKKPNARKQAKAKKPREEVLKEETPKEVRTVFVLPVVARVGGVHVEAVIRKSKKGKEMLHISSVEGGSLTGVSEKAAYDMKKLPAALKGVIFRPNCLEDSEEKAA